MPACYASIPCCTRAHSAHDCCLEGVVLAPQASAKARVSKPKRRFQCRITIPQGMVEAEQRLSIKGADPPLYLLRRYQSQKHCFECAGLHSAGRD